MYLNVYDLTSMNGYAYWLGLGVYHSGVQGTYNLDLFFDRLKKFNFNFNFNSDLFLFPCNVPDQIPLIVISTKQLGFN